MKVMLTGGNGFLGGWVVQMLLDQGHAVYAFDSHRRPLRPGSTWQECLIRCDAMVHLGWYSSAGDGQPALQEHCVEETRQLVAGWSPSRPFVFASTASVYGDAGEGARVETDPCWPNCAYTKAKLAAERIIQDRLPRSLILRLGSLMGKGLTRTKTELIVNAFALAGWGGQPIRCWNPDAWKPVLHVRDAARLIVQAIQEGWQGVLNAAKESLQAREIAGIVAGLTGGTVEEVPSPNGCRSVRLATCKLRKMGFEPQLGIPEAVAELRGYRETTGDRNEPERWKTPEFS